MTPRGNPAVDQTPSEWEATVIRDVFIGSRVGEYVVKRRLGHGGMGIVYEGEHPVIKRRVAIKILRPDVADPERGKRLLEEARLSSLIHHRGVIDVFAFGEIPNVGHYIVMEYLEGIGLDEEVRRHKVLIPAEVCSIVDEILSALEAAHAHGVIHRDLKPSNVFLVRESPTTRYVKVLDFGLAKQAASSTASANPTHAGLVAGTPEYMAPEQARGEPVSAKSDLYSVGCIAFELLTGRLPFGGPTPLAIATRHVTDAPPAPRSLNAAIPAEVEAFVLRLMEKDPRARPASAGAARQYLRKLRQQLAVAETDETFPAVKNKRKPEPAEPESAETLPAVKTTEGAETPVANDVVPPPPTVEAPRPRAVAAPSRARWFVLGGALALGLTAFIVRWPRTSTDGPNVVAEKPVDVQPEQQAVDPVLEEHPPQNPVVEAQAEKTNAVTPPSDSPVEKASAIPVQKPATGDARRGPPSREELVQKVKNLEEKVRAQEPDALMLLNPHLQALKSRARAADTIDKRRDVAEAIKAFRQQHLRGKE